MLIDIKILHSPCCGSASPLRQIVETAASKAGVKVNIAELSDLQEVVQYGTTSFPSIVINGQVMDFKEFKDPDKLVNLFEKQKISV
ncbi:thioredoxin family protein [Negadavirga shengliensis]|uniref:Thioredoxin family protein n=1 Tax=Negadavirga shengliensis TaxID=1389218 RepID=A0ABV9T740_9BACT